MNQLGDLDTRPHWEALRAHQLVVQRCSDCGILRWQPRQLCWACQSWNYDWIAVSGKAELYSWIVTHRAPVEFAADLPYVVVMVKLAEGELYMPGRLVDATAEELRQGMTMEACFVDVSDTLTLAAWRPSR